MKVIKHFYIVCHSLDQGYWDQSLITTPCNCAQPLRRYKLDMSLTHLMTLVIL